MRTLAADFALMAFTVAATTAALANPYSPVIGGLPVYCTTFDDRPVATIIDSMLPDVGRAIPGPSPIIVLNPAVLSQLTPRMQLFWYAHECAHHRLGPANSEINADCWAIKLMRTQGLLRREDLPELQAQIAMTPGSIWGHLPGPQRAQLFAGCFAAP
jgi:hypothetical protein